jgi:hypothetical protein
MTSQPRSRMIPMPTTTMQRDSPAQTCQQTQPCPSPPAASGEGVNPNPAPNIQPIPGTCDKCGHKMIEADEGRLWWLDDTGRRTGDALTICGGKIIAVLRCRNCGWSSLWTPKNAKTNHRDIYAARRRAAGFNARLKRLNPDWQPP